MFTVQSVTALLLAASLASAAPAKLNARSSAPVSSISAAQWASFNQTVGGRLFANYPVAKPCYSLYEGKAQIPNPAQCSAVQNGYTDETYIASQPGGYMNSNWGFCQRTGLECGLDWNLPSDPLYTIAPSNCRQGATPSYYVDVQSVSDVQATLAFVQKTGVALVVKNSGHDYKGRSSGIGSLALWTHNLQPALKLTKGFLPEGCSAPAADGVTMGAGQAFGGLYQFAEANGITIVGGSSTTVGAAGGWISGGGHSSVSNTLGLGVDNVLEIKTVLPNGTYVTANRCQNQDLFFALRGGGGSTFGVNIEMTTTAQPKLELQVAYIGFLSVNPNAINKFIEIAVQNGDQWANDGWGGYIVPGQAGILESGLVMFTPRLSNAEAKASMKPMTDWVTSLGNIVLKNEVDSSPSFYQAYQTYLLPNEEKVGLGLAIGSRLIPKALFQSTSGQQSVTAALQKIASEVVAITGTKANPDLKAATYGGPLQILVTAPSSYQDNDSVPSAVTPAWRDSHWHVIAGQAFANNADVNTISQSFQTAHDAVKILEGIAPNSGAYQNEADVFQDDALQAYWGSDNYDRLLSIKQQLDPNNILTCWDCIGWDSSDARYGCYPAAPS